MRTQDTATPVRLPPGLLPSFVWYLRLRGPRAPVATPEPRPPAPTPPPAPAPAG